MLIPVRPMLANLTDNKPFTHKDWTWEDKIDGMRVIIVTGKDYHIFARSGEEKTLQFPEIKVRTKDPSVLDGEIAIRGTAKKWDFQAIQRRMNRDKEIKEFSEKLSADFYAFDIVSIEGKSKIWSPLYDRKRMLKQQLYLSDNVHLVEGYTDSEELLKKIGIERGEGIIGKDLYERYRENSRRWIKIKFAVEKWFDVCGYTDGLGKRKDKFGTLVICQTVNGFTKILGEVGTGFSDNEMYDILRYMKNIKTDVGPFINEPVHYIQPGKLQVLVRYLEITNDGMLRGPSVLEYRKE